MQPSAQAAPERVGLRRLTPPKSLSALLAVVVVVGVTWALVVPPWQAPDEVSHFAYAQSLAESFTLPGIPGRRGISSDQSVADTAVGASRGAFYPDTSPPDWNAKDFAAYLAKERGPHPPARSDGSGPGTATQNPPLYYLFAAIPYLVDRGGTAFGRLYAIRLSGVLLLAATTLSAWLLAGEVFGRRRMPQLTCAAITGLLPMVTFMSTSVNPDALLITLWTVALWLGARVINHRASSWDVLALCAVTAAAILTKATSYALVAPVILAVIIGWACRPAPERRRALLPIGAAGLLLAVPVLTWVGLAHRLGGQAITTIGSATAHPFNVRQFLSYVWQFYLPRLPWLTTFPITPQLPVYALWLKQGTGEFGWLDVYLPGWLYPLSGFVIGGIGITATGLIARMRQRMQRSLLAFFGLTLIALLGLLHVSEYRFILSTGGHFVQGRYLLPVASLLGLSAALIISRISIRARAAACALTLISLLALQAVSLAAVVQGYYL